MSNQLTPMQELIEHISRKGVKNYPLDTLELIKELLPKEQQVIEDAVNDTQIELIEKNIPELGKTYYKEKFKKY